MNKIEDIKEFECIAYKYYMKYTYSNIYINYKFHQSFIIKSLNFAIYKYLNFIKSCCTCN